MVSLQFHFSDHNFFLIFINDLNFAIKNSTVFYFADDTCLLNGRQSIKEIKESVKKDLKSLIHWLNANKISLNVIKTEVIIVRARGKDFDTDLKLECVVSHWIFLIMLNI